MGNSELMGWLNIPLSQIEKDVERLINELIRTRHFDPTSEIGTALLDIKRRLRQIREEIPKPQ